MATKSRSVMKKPGMSTKERRAEKRAKNHEQRLLGVKRKRREGL